MTMMMDGQSRFACFLLSLLWLGVRIATAATTGILLPLYIYPGGSDWEAVYEAIEANPGLEFTIIINPGTGPGNDTPGYDNVWIVGLDRLNGYPNVRTLGYVNTDYGRRDLTAVYGDLNLWADWTTSGLYNISIHGIFFDEAASKDKVLYMAQATGYARGRFAADDDRGGFRVVFNTGVVPTADDATAYYELADAVVVAETCWTDAVTPSCALAAARYRDAATLGLLDAARAAQSAVLVHEFAAPPAADAATLRALLGNLVAFGIGSTYFTSAGYADGVMGGAATVGEVAACLSRLQNLTVVDDGDVKP